MRVQFLLAVLACLLPSTLVHGGAFSPPGLYDPETYVLENGLRVVLKPRHHSRSVSFRLAVGLGFWDFPCDKQELPHFIEHLLFAGTSRYGESELDAMVIRQGGYWNATTDSESTIYELEIHSRHALLGLDLLHHILTDAQFSQDQVELSRSIVHRESGGEPSALRQWLYRQGIGKTGFDKYLAATGYGCAGLPTAGTITRDELLAVKARYYVPEKMALVAVGDFDAGDMRERIADLFGTLPSSSYTLPPRSQPAGGELPAELRSTFAPFVGSQSQVALVFRVPGYVQEETVLLTLLSDYLETRLFEKLRIDSGLAYQPSAEYLLYENQGLFSVYATVAPGAADAALRILQEELARVAAGEFDERTLQDARSYLLLAGAQGVESNGGFADYYASSLAELRHLGRFRDLETALEQLDRGTLAEVAGSYLDPRSAVIIRESPVLTHGELYLLLGLAALLGLLLVLRLLPRTGTTSPFVRQGRRGNAVREPPTGGDSGPRS